MYSYKKSIWKKKVTYFICPLRRRRSARQVGEVGGEEAARAWRAGQACQIRRLQGQQLPPPAGELGGYWRRSQGELPCYPGQPSGDVLSPPYSRICGTTLNNKLLKIKTQQIIKLSELTSSNPVKDGIICRMSQGLNKNNILKV